MPAMFSDAAEVIFEVDWDSAPLSTAGVWTDESAYVRTNPSITTRRGRQSELEEFSYGTLTVEVSNRARRFDPSYAAGPLFGKLLPRKRCRLRLKWSGTTHDVFTGWLTGFPQNYAEAGVDATVTLTAIDSLAVLAEMGLDLNPLAEFIVGRANVAAFMEFDSAGNWLNHLGGINATVTTGVATYGPPLDPVSGDRSAHLGGLCRWGQSGSDTLGAGVDVTLSMWLQIQIGTSYVDQVIFSYAPSGLSLVILSSGNLEIGGGTGPSPTVPDTGIIDGTPHFVTLVSDVSANTLRLYIDGAFRLQTSGSLEGIQYGGADFFGEVTSPGPSAARDIFLQQFTIFAEAFTDAQVLQHYNACLGRVIEPTTTRAARYLDNVGWPAAWRDLAPTTGLGCARGECADVQRSGYAHNALNVTAATEQGRYFAAKDGDVTFHGRYHFAEVARGKTVQATFSDDGSDIRYGGTAGVDWSDREVNNDITVNWSGGAQRSTDSTSITAYTRQSKTITTVLSTGAAATDMAAGLVGWRKDIRARTRGIVVDARANSAHWATLLGLEIGDRIRYEMTPMGVGSQDVRNLTLEAIEWSISGDQYIVTLYGSPIPDVFILDESLLDVGRLGF